MDAFHDTFTHSATSQSYFIQIQDLGSVVARIASTDDADADWVQNLVQRAHDALPPAPTTPDDADADQDHDDNETSAPPPKDTPESLAAKRTVLNDLVRRLADAQSPSDAAASGRLLNHLGDRDLVGFTNLFLSLGLALLLAPEHRADLAALVRSLVQALAPPATVQVPTSHPTLASRYTALATLFNALPATTNDEALSPARLEALTTLVRLACAHDDVAILRPALAARALEQHLAGASTQHEADQAAAQVVEALLKNAGASRSSDPIGTAQLAREILLNRLEAAQVQAGSPQPESEQSDVRARLGATLLALSLASNDVYDFTPLAPSAGRFPALASAGAAAAAGSDAAAPLRRVLEVLLSADGAPQVEALPSQAELDHALREATLLPGNDSHALDRVQLERKVRLVRLARLCEEQVGREVPYEVIRREIGLARAQGAEDSREDDEEEEEVEMWVIDAIRASLLQGRLSQPTRSLHVTRAAPLSTSFTADDKKPWETIQGRLEGWKEALERVTRSVERSLGAAGAGGAQVQGQGGRQGGLPMVNGHKEEVVGGQQLPPPVEV
ncbi:hypothetical protein JCM8202_002526 [Rhodotorula sphaerocarpa]